MLAHALLTVLAAPAKATAPTPGPTATTALIPLTRNEIRHLFVLLLHRAQATVELLLHWSRSDDITKSPPEPATTAGAPISNDHELLEYSGVPDCQEAVLLREATASSVG